MSRTPEPPVTPGELRALRAYLETGSTKAAARRLGCAQSTVKNHLFQIRQRIGAKTTAQAVYLLHDELAA